MRGVGGELQRDSSSRETRAKILSLSRRGIEFSLRNFLPRMYRIIRLFAIERSKVGEISRFADPGGKTGVLLQIFLLFLLSNERESFGASCRFDTLLATFSLCRNVSRISYALIRRNCSIRWPTSCPSRFLTNNPSTP